jgi:flagellar assembly factor FliW
MIIQTTRFGELELESFKVITFPFGLPGFEHLSQWCILHPEGDLDISWFQSVEDPSIALLTANPDALFPDYDIEVNERDLAPIGVRIEEGDTDPPPVVLRVVVTINRETQDLTANLRAPILINTITRLGLQLPLIGTDFAVSHPLIVPPRPDASEPMERKVNGSKVNGNGRHSSKTNGQNVNGKQGNGDATTICASLSVKPDSKRVKSHVVANS